MQDFNGIKRLMMTEALRIGYKLKNKGEILEGDQEIEELINKLPPLKNMIGFEKNGSHPIHGSNTGRNLHVNSQKQIWYCFRHNVGGGKFQWYAVQEGIIDCSQANKMNRRDKALVIERLKRRI